MANRARLLLMVALGALVVLFLLGAAYTNWQRLVVLQQERFDNTVRQGRFEDYVAFYTAGDFVLHGRGEDLYDLDAIADREVEIMGREVGGTGRLGFFNPPFVAVMFAPLALLPVDVAALVLLLVNIALVLLAGAILQRMLGIRGVLAAPIYWMSILSLYALYWMLGHGQLSMFVLLGFLGFFGFERKGMCRLSGLSLGFVLIKPQMAILPILVLLYKRRWQELKSFSAIAALFVVVSVVVSGPGMLVEYPRFALNAGEWESQFAWQVQRMYGLNGLIATVIDKNSLAHLLTTALATVGVGVFAVRAFRGEWKPSTPSFALAVSGLIAATVLVNPHVWMQDMVLVPLIVALGFLGSQRREATAMFWVTLGTLVWTAQWASFRVEETYGVNLQTPLLLAAFLVALWEIRMPAAADLNEPAAAPDATAVKAAA
jgi:hypothetical protein